MNLVRVHTYIWILGTRELAKPLDSPYATLSHNSKLRLIRQQ